MRLKEVVKSDNGVWASYHFYGTWRSTWDFILETAQLILYTEFDPTHLVEVGLRGEENRRITEELARVNGDLRRSVAATEHDILVVAGDSKSMGFPVRFTFFNNTDRIILDAKLESLREQDRENPEVFTQYLSSLEISGYAAMARKGMF